MKRWPLPNDAVQRAYAGDTFLLEPHPAALAMCHAANDAVRAVFQDPLHAHDAPLSAFLDGLHAARSRLRHPRFRGQARGLLRALGEVPDDWFIDTVRLRGVPPGGPTSRAAEAAWAVHRDTWYANPAAQLNLWLPLVPVTPATSVQIYPELFDVAVPNSSADFDYASFRRTAGFQASRPGRAHYPAASVPPRSEPVGIHAPVGALFLFSAQHLHGTPAHNTLHTRWSLDLRIVNRAHHRSGLGAPCLDSFCSGSAVEDYPW